MKFILDKDNLTIEEPIMIVSGSVNYYEIDVEHDASWDDLTIKAIIVSEGEAKEIAVLTNKVFLNDAKGRKVFVGFVGYKIEDEKKTYQISTNLKSLTIKKGAGEVETEETTLPTVSEWEIYVEQIKEIIEEKSFMPSGGTTGQVLIKKSDKDYDCGWSEQNIDKEIDPTVPEYIKKIQEQDIKNWNNKVDKVEGKELSSNDFTDEEKQKLEGLNNYDDTQLKKDIESKQDRGEYITKSVNDLLNYYLKSESYSKEEINTLIGQIKTISIQKVSQLPTIGQDNIIYLVPKESSTNDVHNEYIYIDNSWELIGNTQIDLTGYATEEWINIQIKDFLNTTQVNDLISTALSNYYIKEEVDNLLNNKIPVDVTNYIEGHKEELKGDAGPQGEPGKDGYTPIKGIDYFTETDKQEMINSVLTSLPNSEEVEY